ncbi:MAG: hypothetical protein WDN49_20320 [Acetobacteraceae bacterium]
MKLMLCLLLVSVAVTAHAAAPETRPILLRCELTNNPPRAGGRVPDTFTQHFRVNLVAGTVDGRRATVTADTIGWEPRQDYLRPYATLSRPGWRYHSARVGSAGREVNGPCTEVK